MAEKLTMKLLSEELETLRKQLVKMETRFERKLESALEKATEKLKSRLDSTAGQARHGRAVDVDARRRLIAQCAYLRAERRGFVGGDPAQDWLDAEMEIDQLLLQGWTKDDTENTDEVSEPLELKPQPERRV
jgi:Protein of unknown function (DUF2934)